MKMFSEIANFNVAQVYNEPSMFVVMSKKSRNKKHSENADTSTSVTFDLEL